MRNGTGQTVRWAAVGAACLLGALLAGCGGGGGGSSSAEAATGAGAYSLRWDPPRTYVDNSPLDPSRAIDRYEVFVSSDNAVSPDDEPIACVSGSFLEGAVVTPVTAFDMRNIAPYVLPGTVYYVSVRAVGVDNQASERTVPLEWDPEA